MTAGAHCTITISTEKETALHVACPQVGTVQPDPKWEMCHFPAFSDHLTHIREKFKFSQILYHIKFGREKLWENYVNNM